MDIVVAGLLRHDSGKTSFAAELIEAMRDLGVYPGVFKPVGGHSCWWQWETVYNSMELGVLVGSDAYRLASLVGWLDYIDIVSPLDILTAPLDPGRAVTLRSYLDEMDSLSATAVLARLTMPGEGGRGNVYLLVEDNYSRSIEYCREAVDELLGRVRRSGVIRVNRAGFERMLYTPTTYMPHIEAAYRIIRGMRNIVVIESFNNAAYPVPRPLSTEGYAVAVAPGKIMIYRLDRYIKAIQLTGTTINPLYIETHKIIQIAGRPIKTLEWKPQTNKKYSEAAEQAADILLNKNNQ